MLSVVRNKSARLPQPTGFLESDPEPVQSASGCWLYFALFGMQTIGAVVLFWTALRVYRQVLTESASHEAQPWAIAGSLSSIALMQISYWISYRVRMALPHFSNALLGHAILFLARMVFVLPTSIFGVVFIAQRPQFEIEGYQYLVILLGLFSLFCYVRELERLSRVFTN